MTILWFSCWYFWIICITMFWFVLWWLWGTFCIDVFLLMGRGLWRYSDVIRACIVALFDDCGHRVMIISGGLGVFITMNIIIPIFFQGRFDETICSNIFIASTWSVWLSWCFICLRFVRNTLMIIIWNWISCKLMKIFVRFKIFQLYHRHQYYRSLKVWEHNRGKMWTLKITNIVKVITCSHWANKCLLKDIFF